MNVFGVVDWRSLDLKENIHYCDENKSTDTAEPNQVCKKSGKWFMSTRRKLHKKTVLTVEEMLDHMVNNHISEIDYCPFCGVKLFEVLDDGDIVEE